MKKKFKIVEWRAEGPKDDPVIIGNWQEIDKFDSYNAARSQFLREIELYRRSGSEVIEINEMRAVLVSDSDRARKVIDILEL